MVDAWVQRHLYSIQSDPCSFQKSFKKNGLDAQVLNSLTSAKCAGFPGGSDGKASACNAEDPGSIPGSGRSSGEGNGHVTLFEQHCSGLHHSLSVSLDDTVVLGDQGKASHITPLIYFRFTVR